MRRATAVTLMLAALAVAGCGSRTPAETAYLAAIQDGLASTTVSDPGRYLTEGHAVCDQLADTKPERRAELRYLMQRPTAYGYSTVNAAVTHLCPELKA